MERQHVECGPGTELIFQYQSAIAASIALLVKCPVSSIVELPYSIPLLVVAIKVMKKNLVGAVESIMLASLECFAFVAKGLLVYESL